MELEYMPHSTDEESQNFINTYLSSDDKDSLLNKDIEHQIKHIHVPIIIQGMNKAGKSLLCN